MEYQYSNDKEVKCKDTGEVCKSSEYLNTRHWRRIRKYIYDKREGVCERCGQKYESAHMNVHHKTYEHIGDEREDELCLLCEHCHAIVHGNMPDENGEQKEDQRFFKQGKGSMKNAIRYKPKKKKARARKCNTCKHLAYTVIGRGAGYKCTLRNKTRHYLYTCVCDKFERK